MKVGIIGVGNITLELAHRSAKSGHEVLISNPAGNNTIKELTKNLGSNVKLVTTPQAALAEIIILFIARENLETSIKSFPDMAGKIILHTNNPLFNINFLSYTGSDQSSTALIASLLPNSHVVKMFNPIKPIMDYSDIQMDYKTKVFFDGGDQTAKNNVKTFLDTLNFSAIDLSQIKD